MRCSRNANLTPEARQQALAIPQALQVRRVLSGLLFSRAQCLDRIVLLKWAGQHAGEEAQPAAQVAEAVSARIAAAGGVVDYVEVSLNMPLSHAAGSLVHDA